MRLFLIAWECSVWNYIMVSLNRKADIFENLNIAILILYQTYTFISNCVGVWVEEIVLCGVRWGHMDAESQWGSCSGTKIVMTSCFMWFKKGWKIAWLLNNSSLVEPTSPQIFFATLNIVNITTEEEKQPIWESVPVSSVGWSFWCRVDRLFRWAAPLLL